MEYAVSSSAVRCHLRKYVNVMKHLPGSTYRLQLHKHFTLDDASAIADYLKQLGITHVYSSPYLQAAPGSMHGYDVVDHRRVNEELGGEAAHERFCKRLGEAGLGQVLDIVPNHMSLGVQNRYWWDVLENGANSLYASFFDIDWNSSEATAARQSACANSSRSIWARPRCRRNSTRRAKDTALRLRPQGRCCLLRRRRLLLC